MSTNILDIHLMLGHTKLLTCVRALTLARPLVLPSICKMDLTIGKPFHFGPHEGSGLFTTRDGPAVCSIFPVTSTVSDFITEIEAAHTMRPIHGDQTLNG